MDAFNEKKWFVYIGDKHEGPFSLKEIEGKMSQGSVTNASYVWAEGMSDWKVMTDVPEFSSIASGSASASEPSEAPMISPAAEREVTGSMDPKAAKKAAKEALKAEKEAKKAEKEAAKKAAKEAKLNAKRLRKQQAELSRPVKEDGPGVSSRLIRLLIVLLIPAGLVGAYMMGYLNPLLENPAVKMAVNSASDAIRPHLITLVEKVPALAPYISPIPRLEDVSAEDYEELKAAAMAPAEGGQKVALALSNGDLLMPVFYVSGNVPDGKQFKVWVSGLGDTLLNHTAFENSVSVTIDKRLGKTQPVRFPDGKPLPRGDYFVIVSENLTAAQAQAQAKPKPLARKQYFLGGPKDATYAARLKEFHDRLKAKAAAELSELKQFAATLEMQFNSTTAGFNKFKGRAGKVSKAQLKGWNDLHTKWGTLDGQLAQTFLKWTPETVSKDYFYAVLYLMTQQASQAVTALHQVQHSYFGGGVNPQQFEAALSQAQASAAAALSNLKAKIDQAEKMPPTPKGLPRREGL